MTNQNAEQKNRIDGLKISLTESLEKIEKSKESLSNVPIDKELKTELLIILENAKKSLLTAQPVVKYIDEVRDLILSPVQSGIKESFKESNKWGIRGIKIAIVSMFVTIIIGIVGLYYSNYNKSRSNFNREIFLLSDFDKSSVIKNIYCNLNKNKELLNPFKSPVINMLLVPYGNKTNDKSIYISGSSLKLFNRITFGGFDVQYKKVNENLIEIRELPATVSEPELKISFNTILDSTGYKLDIPISFWGENKNQEEKYSAKVVIKDYPLLNYNTIYKHESNFALGYFDMFGHNIPLKGFENKINFENTDLSNNSDCYMLIHSVGIGPFVDTYISQSGVYINDSFYEFKYYNPNFYNSSSVDWECNFIIPIKKYNIINGINKVHFVSGQFKDSQNGDEIRFDNFIIEKFSIVKTEHNTLYK